MSAPINGVLAKSSPSGSSLLVMKLENFAERELLYKQRVICGWKQDAIQKWREAMARKDQYMFWICVPIDSEAAKGQSTAAATDQHKQAMQVISRKDDAGNTQEGLAVGHLSLDWADLPDDGEPELTLASKDGTILSVSALFVMPTHQKYRLGTFAMDTLETYARQVPFGSPNCQTLTINTLHPRYFNAEGPDGVGMWKLIGAPMNQMDNSLWYARRGFVPYKEYKRYRADTVAGGEIWLYCLCMRKQLGELKPL